MEVRTCVGEAIRNGALVTWYKDVDVPFESTINLVKTKLSYSLVGISAGDVAVLPAANK
jgi:hypothetical protein